MNVGGRPYKMSFVLLMIIIPATRLSNVLYISIAYIYRIFVVGRVVLGIYVVGGAMLGILNDLIEKNMHVIIIIRL